MTKHYETRDGIKLTGSTAAEIIDSLRANSMDPRQMLREFMLATARAAEMQTGQPVNGDLATELLAGLVSSGLVIEWES